MTDFTNRSHPLLSCLVIALSLFSTALSAAEIRLKDGRTIEGKVLRVTGDKVTIQKGSSTFPLPRDQVIAPDLAQLTAGAKAAAEKGDFALTIDLCEEILVWDASHSQAAGLLARAKEGIGKAQAKERVEGEARAKEQEAQEKGKAAREAREKKLETARRLLTEGDRTNARTLCREALNETPDDPQAKRLLADIKAAEEQTRKKAAMAENLSSPQRLKDVLAQIEAKLAGVKECSYLDSLSYKAPKGELAYREECCFRRPNLSYTKHTQTKHIIPGATGAVTLSVCDGTTFWHLMQNAPGSGREMAAKMKAVSPERIEEMIRRHETPQLYKCDLQRLDAAGYSVADVSLVGMLLEPFDLCDMSTLRLTKEDASVWVFDARARAGIEGGKIRITIGRSDGILRKMEFLYDAGEAASTDTVSDVRINPTLPDGLFVFTPPAGVEAKDNTDSMIQDLKDKGVKPRKQP